MKLLKLGPDTFLQRLWFAFARDFCWVFCRIFLRFKVYGRENVPRNGAVLLVCNHQSFLDPVLCGSPLRRHMYFLARDSLFKNKFMDKLLRSINTIPVRRGEADLTAMRTVISKLKQGRSVCIFPEATRSSDGKISDFKAGFGLLCRRANAALVPVVIDGAFECWPRDRKIFTPWSRVTVSYGQCIGLEELKSINEKDLAAEITDRIRQMQSRCRRQQAKAVYKY